MIRGRRRSDRGAGAASLAAPGATITERVVGGLKSGGTYWMLVGSFLAAIGAYLFQMISSRSLGEVRYAPIGTLWTIQYLAVSIFLYAVETYVTRATLRAEADAAPAPSLTRVWLSVGVVSVSIGLVSWSFRRSLFQERGDLAIVAGCVVVTFGAFIVVRGRLAGAGRFKAYGLVTASESLVRFVLAVGVAAAAGGTRAFAWTMPVGALVAATWWIRLKRRTETERVEVPSRPAGTARFLALTTASNASTQLLLAGGPLVLAFLGARPAAISVFFVTITAARLPIVFVFGGILSRVLGTFTRLAETERGEGLRRAAVWIATGTVVVAVVGGAAAAAVGSPLIALLFGPGFRPAWWLAGGATVAVLAATGAMVLNQVLVATGSEGRLPWPWGVALLGAAMTIAVVGGSPVGRVTTAFVIGEAIALLGLTIAILTDRRADVDPAGTAYAEPGSGPPLDRW